MDSIVSWEQLSRVEQVRCEYSDLHKDAYGFRSYLPTDISEAEAETAVDELIKAAEVIFEREKEYERQRIEKFEQYVTQVIDLGAGNRETAIRWIMDGSDANGDWGMLCYNLGLPYNYFRSYDV